MNMPKLQPRLLEIKSDSQQEWFDWCAMLSGELNEKASATLQRENVAHEFFVNFMIESSWYALGVAITNDSKMPGEADMSLAINQRHKAMKSKCLEFVSVVDYAYYLADLK